MSKAKIAIVGGGCSGLLLANLLSNSNVEIFLFEKNNKLGKKILASGNGKCNFTNVGSFDNKYNNSFANLIVNKFGVEDTLKEFRKMGLIYKSDDQGRCYPVSECASSVLDCLKAKLNNVHILLDCEVKTIISNNNGYFVEYNKCSEYFDYVICCSGSIASNLGSNKAYSYLSELGVKMEELRAALVPIIVREKISGLRGVRVKCLLKLINKENEVVYEENGEVLFREDSLSGIATFNASSFLNRNKSEYRIVLDLSSGMENNELHEYINKKKNNNSSIFKGFLNDKLAEYILSIQKYKTVEDLVDSVCNLTFHVEGVYPLQDGQVCSGGVALSEVNENLELKKHSNVYIAGELLDIDGVSGGYNMQFAWSSAGVIAKDIKNKLK